MHHPPDCSRLGGRQTARYSRPCVPRWCRSRPGSDASRAARTSSRCAASSAARHRFSVPARADHQRPWPWSPMCSRSRRAGRRLRRRARRPIFIKVSSDFVAPHYVRFTVNDKPGILAAVTTAYAQVRHQHRRRAAAAEVPQGSPAVRHDARGVLGVRAGSRARRSCQERLPRAAAPVAADLRLTWPRSRHSARWSRPKAT